MYLESKELDTCITNITTTVSKAEAVTALVVEDFLAALGPDLPEGKG
jgi:hypothetical protein